VLELLKIIEPRVEALSFVADPDDGRRRIAKVRLTGSSKPLPLEALGDGIVRMFQIAVAMLYAEKPAGVESPSTLPQNVFRMLLIDEAEAGIHYSLHADLWRFIFEAARMLEVQVFATTHSWDCVKGFGEALKDAGPEDGLMIRLEKAEGQSGTGAVIIDRDDLPIVVRESIEVR
jgi:predicted ATPase